MNLRGEWLPAAAVEQALAGARDVRALHFIFHAGHVGSTLLSRLLDEARGVLSLREPLPLRAIAEHFSPARLELLLRLWERGFDGTHCRRAEGDELHRASGDDAARDAPAIARGDAQCRRRNLSRDDAGGREFRRRPERAGG